MLSHVAGMNQTVHVDPRLICFTRVGQPLLLKIVEDPSFMDLICTLMNIMLFNHLSHSILLAWLSNTLATLRPVHVVINLLPFRLINFLLLMLIPVVVGAFDIVSIVLIIVGGDPTPNC